MGYHIKVNILLFFYFWLLVCFKIILFYSINLLFLCSSSVGIFIRCLFMLWFEYLVPPSWICSFFAVLPN
ncbi:unnamed protein product [Cyberlindnera jadinii]|uniref:Uncharacterized protein n=1 Tax=Cyberlindnera jadinii (strain ATCC 18201 / CBS 1600 / BCRC 20928 / JCM 3617 / NBRC 0987 / NRRL Y-1542) TaxID=983966 RepID=A0A0H5CHR8_CYBJN|nr:unnamed protein product [Cyberlindnera jadinii]